MGKKSSVPLHIVLCSIISPKILQEGLSVCAFGLGIPPWLFYEKGLSQGKNKRRRRSKQRLCPELPGIEDTQEGSNYGALFAD